MLKRQIIVLCTLLSLVLACSKNDTPDTPPVNATLKAVQDYLSQTDNLNTFAVSFQATTIAEADLGNGLTVFAPINSAITSYDPNARVEAISLTAGEIKDHIVRGVIKKADLANGKKLLALSGKELVVNIDGDKIYVNGALILDTKEETSNSVFTIDNVLCKKPGSVEITVYDATQWSATDTLGKPAAYANVALYYSRKDFINRSEPAFSGQTSGAGKILFGGLAPGTYYLVTKKDDKFNYFESELINGELFAYKPIGIFQNQNQLGTLPRLGVQSAGDFIFLDANQDGIVNAIDKTWIPFEVVVASNKTVQVNSMVGYIKNSLGSIFSTPVEAQQSLSSLYTSIFAWHQLQTVIDGMMSDDADCNTLNAFCAFDNFSFNASNSYVTSFWQNAYSYIPQLNRLINNVRALNLTTPEENDLIGQARGLRGFVYYELATYFGELPLQFYATDYNLSRSSLGSTYNTIKTDLTAAMSLLPLRYTGADHNRINSDACKLLLARVAMAEGDYQRAAILTDELIARSVYSLMSPGTIFTNDDNVETIWNIQPGFVSAYNSFYNGSSSKTFTPVARYAEVLLINSEAKVYMNTLDPTYINQLLMFRGQPTVTFTDAAQAMDIIRTAWKNEMPREGQRFAKLVQWGNASAVLGAKGFKNYNTRLPIPIAKLNVNLNLVQNPGY